MSQCKACGDEVIWINSAKNNRPMILDPEIQISSGTNPKLCLVTRDGRVVRNPSFGTEGYIDHNATCPGADLFRSREVGKTKHCDKCGFDYKASKCPRCS